MLSRRLSSAERWRRLAGPGRLTALCWVLCALVGLLHGVAGAASQSMNPDGISYLNVGEAILDGDRTLGLNGYWSPLYALLLGLAVGLVQPGPRWEFVVVQAANFGVYLLALSAFAFFWSELLRGGAGEGELEERGHVTAYRPAAWPWIVAGYALFLWTAIYLIELWGVTPDMLVAACVYSAAGLLLRVRRAPTGRGFALLGVVVGLGYLAKAAFLPVGLIFLLATWLVARRRARWGMRAAALAAGGFLVVAGPFAVALSAQKGRPTVGDSGRLNYAWYVNGVPQLHWRGEGAGEGEALHPTRILLESPRVYEFDGPVAGTYPPWSDPSYWYEGLEIRFRLQKQLETLLAGGLHYFRWGFRFLGGVLFVFAAAWLVRRGDRTTDGRSWLLGVPAAVGLTMYALVYVEGRYVAPYVVLGLAALAVPLFDRDLSDDGRLATAAAVTMSLVLLLNVVSFNLAGLEALAFGGSIGEQTDDPLPTHAGEGALNASGPAWRVAEELRARGVGAGERVAYIGHGVEESEWARLARLRIVAEMYPWDAPRFWFDSPAQRRTVEAMRTTGATAVVTGAAPSDASLGPGWEALGETGFHLLTLRAGGDSPPEDR